MMSESDLIVRLLCDPSLAKKMPASDWDLAIRQARRANLLGKLAVSLQDDGLLELVPSQPMKHLVSALKMADRQDVAIRWEVRCIADALCEAGLKAILLKGAAYVLAGVPGFRGRTFSDVDILVPKRDIDAVESALMLNGWQGSHHDEYDQRYYRQWMHEIPPMLHVRRNTTIDVHHSILPETARIKVDSVALQEDPLPVSGFDNIFVLKPVDMLLHSATHLFHEGEFDNGLRDLFDLDALFRQFGKDPDFWSALLPRARELALERPLYYAVSYSGALLGTVFPGEFLESIAEIAPSGAIVASACYRRALRPHHTSCHSRGEWLARKALFVRSHWIKMPFTLLLRHLVHKTFSRPEKPELEPFKDEQKA